VIERVVRFERLRANEIVSRPKETV